MEDINRSIDNVDDANFSKFHDSSSPPPPPFEIVAREEPFRPPPRSFFPPISQNLYDIDDDDEGEEDDEGTIWHTAQNFHEPKNLIDDDDIGTKEENFDDGLSRSASGRRRGGRNGHRRNSSNGSGNIGFYFRRRPFSSNGGGGFDENYETGTSSDLGVDEDVEMEDLLGFCFPGLDSAREHAGQFVKKVWEASWKATHWYSLPEWLQDNDYLHSGYRPPLPSFNACFKSIFRVHTETGNIWSHMLGCAAFLGIAAYFLTRPSTEIQMQEKLVFSAFFAGAIACLGLSSAFHTVNCHSERVGRLFCKLDYVGITLLIIGSFIPWLFYCFYCRPEPKIVYCTSIVVLGIGCIVVSLWDKFSEPMFRPVRAGMFVCLALSGLVPCFHYIITEGYWSAIDEARFGWLMLMALLYICGTVLYALRIPERFFPGKCDIWFQSHQLFHLFVVMAAFVHYHGISEMAVMRLQGASCEEKAFFNQA